MSGVRPQKGTDALSGGGENKSKFNMAVQLLMSAKVHKCISDMSKSLIKDWILISVRSMSETFYFV